jgi:hypothetical protein
MTEKLIDGEASIRTDEAIRGLRELADAATRLASTVDSANVQNHLSTQKHTTAIGALKAGFDTLNKTVEKYYQRLREVEAVADNVFSHMVESTSRIERHTTALNNLGGAWSLVEERTRGAVTAEQAVRVQQSLTQAGYRVTGDQLATITARAREYAIANGTDLNQSLEQVTETLRGLSQEGLQRYDVHLHNARTRGDAFRQTVSQMRDQLERAGTSEQRMAESADILRRNWQQMQDGIIGRIAQWLQLQTAIQGVNDILSGTISLSGQTNTVGRIGHENQASIESARNRLNAAGATRYFSQNDLGRLSSHDMHQVAWYVEHGDIEGARRAMGVGQSNRDALNARDSAAMAQTPSGPSTATERSTYGSSGGGNSHSIEDLKRDTANAINEIQRLGGTWDQIQRVRGETEEHFWQRYQNHAEGALAHAREEVEITQSIRNHQLALNTALLEEKRIREQEIGEALKRNQERIQGQAGRRGFTSGDYEATNNYGVESDQLESMRRASSYSEQFAQTFGATAENIQTTAQTTASIVGQAWGAMTGSFKSHLGALIEGKEDAAAAFGGMLHEALLSIAEESTIQALFNGAKAVAALASQQYAQAGQFATAAAMYAGVAVATGVGAALTTPHPAGAAGGGFANSTGHSAGTGPSNDNATGGSVTNVINITGLAMTQRQAQNGVANALDRFGMRGRTMVSNRRRAA